MGNNFVPFAEPLIGEKEKAEVIACLESGWLTSGPRTEKFEEKVKSYLGAKHVLAVNSCTAALHLSLLAYSIADGDEVITSPYTFCSTSNVILHQRAVPVFVDINPNDFNINVEKIEEKITRKTKAIMPVHFGGQPCEMDGILAIAEANDLIVIEDAAHAIGAEYKGKKVGVLGDATCFSLYAAKNITSGEGGMVSTGTKEIADKIELYRLHGMSKDTWKRADAPGSWYYEILVPGYKYNMIDLQAAIGMHQIDKLDQFNQRRINYARIYDQAFSPLPEITVPERKRDVRHAYHLYSILINVDQLTIGRNQFIEELKQKNIGTTVNFIPMHLQPYYTGKFGYKKGDFPVAEWVYERTLSLPLYPKMTEQDVLRVIEAVTQTVENHRK